MGAPDVTVVIPTIPPRVAMLRRALASVDTQLLKPVDVIISEDHDREGVVATRNRALMAVTSEWTAFLDDDDELLPHHLRVCRLNADRLGADVIYPGCRVVDARGRTRPLRDEWGRFGKKFDAKLLRRRSYIPVTSLVRTELAQRVGGFAYPPGSAYDDWGFYLRLLDAGARFEHVPVITWVWHHHGANTSGRPDRW